jgi:vacuolar-type H+-ATPase subunit F/Vma7
MSRVAAIGEEPRVVGYALAGVQVHAVADADAAKAAFAALEDDVACLILTPATHAALAARLAERPYMLWTVTPA